MRYRTHFAPMRFGSGGKISAIVTEKPGMTYSPSSTSVLPNVFLLLSIIFLILLFCCDKIKHNILENNLFDHCKNV